VRIALAALVLGLSGCAGSTAEKSADAYFTASPTHYEGRLEFDDGTNLNILIVDNASSRCYQIDDSNTDLRLEDDGDALLVLRLAPPTLMSNCPE
jgi:hypothetical protein